MRSDLPRSGFDTLTEQIWVQRRGSFSISLISLQWVHFGAHSIGPDLGVAGSSDEIQIVPLNRRVGAPHLARRPPP